MDAPEPVNLAAALPGSLRLSTNAARLAAGWAGSSPQRGRRFGRERGRVSTCAVVGRIRPADTGSVDRPGDAIPRKIGLLARHRTATGSGLDTPDPRPAILSHAAQSLSTCIDHLVIAPRVPPQTSYTVHWHTGFSS